MAIEIDTVERHGFSGPTLILTVCTWHMKGYVLFHERNFCDVGGLAEITLALLESRRLISFNSKS